jgi:Predicted 3'-5' exonuclease related to the exonuclease domain of PolB
VRCPIGLRQLFGRFSPSIFHAHCSRSASGSLATVADRQLTAKPVPVAVLLLLPADHWFGLRAELRYARYPAGNDSDPHPPQRATRWHSDEVDCRTLGLDGKTDGIDGSKVRQFIQEARVEEVAGLLLQDVICTFRLWLIHELFCARLTQEGYEASEASLRAMLAIREIKSLS